MSFSAGRARRHWAARRVHRGTAGFTAVPKRLFGLEAAKVAMRLDTLPHRERLLGMLPIRGHHRIVCRGTAGAGCNRSARDAPRSPIAVRELRPIDQTEKEAEERSAELFLVRKEGSSLEEIQVATACATRANWYADMERQ